MKTAIITAFNLDYAPIADQSLPLLKRYADKHNYALLMGEYHTNPNEPYTYGDRGKVGLFNAHYDEYDVIAWFDIDVLVMNSEVSIESRLCDREFLWTYDINGPCSGFWIARTTPGVHNLLNHVKNQAVEQGKVTVKQSLGPPPQTTLTMEPAGASDQMVMRGLMGIPPFSHLLANCISGREAGHTYLYDDYGWDRYRDVGDYHEGAWLLTFPSLPLPKRLARMIEWAKKAV
jgi:hypothetical protein